jgi:3-hydroxyisobutyrate dehydrogenase-like beta-hydroxyacid dehydrogenase
MKHACGASARASELNIMAADKQNVGVAGLGLIGTSLARRLTGAGFVVHGYDIDAQKCSRLAEFGGRPAASLCEVARACPTVVLAVFNTDQVEAVIESADGLNLEPGQTVVATSTCDPERIAALAARITPRGIRFLEMPLSGNSDQIALGNGVGLVGGDRRVMDEVGPILDAMVARRYYLGEAGAAGKAKLAVNLVGGLNRAVMAEGLVFAESMGIELASFLEVLKGSAAYSRTMDNRGPKMVHNYFTPHAKVRQSLKDFQLMRSYADKAGQQLPLARVYTELIQGCVDHDEGELDNSAIIKEVRRRRKART